jgi:geranylgeranyl diphosphate synthase type II
LPLIHLLRNARGSDRKTIDRYLRLERSKRSAEMVAEIRSLLDDYGSVAFATAYARGIAGAAEDAFETAFAPANAGEDRDFIRAAVPYMLDRRS